MEMSDHADWSLTIGICRRGTHDGLACVLEEGCVGCTFTVPADRQGIVICEYIAADVAAR
jgi:hypothetical protein